MNTGLLAGKKGLIFGIGNKHSIAYGIAKSAYENGATLAITYANDIMEKRVRPIAESFKSPLIMPCDVSSDADINAVFAAYESTVGQLDFVVHSVAYANAADLSNSFSETSRAGWDLALSVSAYSLLPMARWSKKLMTQGGSIIALSFIGGEKSVPFYNIMGVAKAALESSVRYLASELGPHNIRVNTLSPGPIKTLAGKGIKGFNFLLRLNELRSPIRRNITQSEIGNSAVYLLSDLSSGVTGSTLYVDGGIHSIAASEADKLLAQS